MSREIRFRCWNNCLREYIPEDELMDSFGEYLEEKHLYIEQYTGLTDKNGKEIYEGDIVKCYSQDTYPSGRVMYSEKYAEYEIVSYDIKTNKVYSLENFSPIKNKYLEVIGNIHENPELIGGEE